MNITVVITHCYNNLLLPCIAPRQIVDFTVLYLQGVDLGSRGSGGRKSKANGNREGLMNICM